MPNRARFTAQFALLPSILYLSLLVLLIYLGNWQLNRAEEKRNLIAKENSAINSETINLSVDTEENLNWLLYKNTEVSGSYDQKQQLLIDNQMNEGKPGYLVMTPLIIESTGKQKAVLVNRGWIPLNPDRTILPDLAIANINAKIKGRINSFPSVGVKLAGADIPSEGWPSVVQVVNIKILQKRLGYALFNFQIELNKDLADGYKRNWQAKKIMPPEQHTAYAMQWFGLALTLTFLFFWVSIKKD